MNTAIRRLLACATVAFACAAGAGTEPPDALVKHTVEEVLAVINQAPDRGTLRRLAQQKVLPNFDFREMTRLAMGPSWRKATPEQQTTLENGFRNLLVNLYTNALAQGGKRGVERTVDVRPLPQGAARDETVVKTSVREAGGKAVAIDYRMLNRNGDWKVYDVLVEGVSLVTTYRSSFEREVAKGGVEGLIKVLEQKERAALQT